MKTYLIPVRFRHSVIEYFDNLVAQSQVDEFFVGSVDPDTNSFPLTYQIGEGYMDIPLAHFHPFYCDKQYEYRVTGDVEPLEMLSDALCHISGNGTDRERRDAIEAIMGHCKITLSVADFGDDGHFQVESELEWDD
jgi:hypothetical protein